MLRNNP